MVTICQPVIPHGQILFNIQFLFMFTELPSVLLQDALFQGQSLKKTTWKNWNQAI